MLRMSIFILTLFFTPILNAAHKGPIDNGVLPAITQPIPISSIQNYANYPSTVKKLIATSLSLTKMNLTYLYGSSDPKTRGMDCSGTIYYLLNSLSKTNVPRQADEMYAWVEQKGKLYRVKSGDLHSPEFNALKPGDLLFWSGTYATTRAISHVMMYLGETDKGEPIMFGASDGRTYQGKKMWGVSVFDFKMPKAGDRAKFVGYGCIPGLTC